MLKIIQNDKIIDVISFPRYVKFLSTGHVAITNKGSAQGIVGSDTISVYRFASAENNSAEAVSVAEIDQAEYDRLRALLEAKEVVSADEVALAESKRATINRLSNICKTSITNGFSIKLSDNLIHSFRLTTEDQLNLMIIESQLNSGKETFLYHETDQPCVFFTKDDMKKIIEASRKFTLYHTTYFNTAKQYVKSLLNRDIVEAFEYGTDISNTVSDEAIKRILLAGGRVD